MRCRPLPAVTFPLLTFHGDYFQLWPFAKPPVAEEEPAAGAGAARDPEAGLPGHLADTSS